MPINEDFLIRFDNGAVRRFEEDWDWMCETIDLVITHWKPF